MATATLDREDEKALRSPESMTLPDAFPALPTTLRGLRGIRLSVLTDETTSPERQRYSTDGAAAALNISFGEGDELREAIDLDVSASKVGPFDRPELGKWLKKPDEFDAIVFWKFDRGIRSMGDMHELAKWAKQHGKMIVFAEGLGGSGRMVFDFSKAIDPMAELMLLLFAFAAQVESQNIQDRVLGAQAAMRKMSYRFRGGHTGYGYMKAPLEGGGWTLVQDPDAVVILWRIITELIDGKSISAIAYGLTKDRVPNPAAYEKLRKLEEGSESAEKILSNLKPWAPTVITRILTSEKLLGWKLHLGVPVRDAEGNPVLSTEEPILTRSEFDAVQMILKERTKDPVERRDTEAELMRVIHCAGCGGRMYINRDTRTGHEYYKCNPQARGDRCTESPLVKATWVEEYVRSHFLALAGHIQFMTTHTTPGYDPEPELLAVLEEFKLHQEDKGQQKSRGAQAAWQERANALDARIAMLESAEKVEPTVTRVGTGRTIAQEWEEGTKKRRRQILQESGVMLLVRKGKRGARKLDEARVMFLIDGDLDEAIDALGDAEEDTGKRPAPKKGSTLRIVSSAGVQELPGRQTLTTAA